MFKKALILGCALATFTTVAFAYRGHRLYKDEVPRFKDEVPCQPYEFQAGPYVGLSLGSRVNYTRAPAVYKGGEGTLSIGYAAMLTPLFYLALEGFGADNFQLKNYPDAFGNNVKTTWNYGLDLIPGLVITDNFVGYLRAGATRTRFSGVGAYATGWQMGIGGETNLIQNWDIRGEYVYTFYNHVHILKKAYAEQFNIGIVYKFL
jgi:opacity protein-like surface antigen